jgi:hypothetical protein
MRQLKMLSGGFCVSHITGWFPEAEVIIASDLEAFTTAALASPAAIAALPVVEKEIGDTWIMGVPSDPIKVQRMRALERARTACVASPACANWGGSAGTGEAMLSNFTRFFLKNCEHTWGVSVQHFGAFERIGW